MRFVTHSGEHRAYRIDQIEGASVTDIPFIPKYAIELTPAGPLQPPVLSALLTHPAVLYPDAVRPGA